MMSQQNRNLIQVNEHGESDSPRSSQQEQQQLSSDELIQQNNYQPQRISNQNESFINVDESKLNTLTECWSKRLLKENADLLKNHIPGTFPQYQHAKISSLDPKLMLVHGKHFCRLLDLTQASTSSNVKHNILYNTQQQELVYADFESDYMVTVVSNRIDNLLQHQPLLKNVIAQPDQQTFIELRRVRNLDGHSDFVQIPMKAGVRVSRVRVTLETQEIDGPKRPCIFILRKNENIVETKVILKNGRIEHLSSVHYVSIDKNTSLELKLEDIHLFQRNFLSEDDKLFTKNCIALNFSQISFTIMTVQDFLQQRDAGGIFDAQEFNPNFCESLSLLQLDDRKSINVERSKLTQVVYVDIFRIRNQRDQLILVRQSLSIEDTPHEIDVIDLQSGDLMDSAEIKFPHKAKLQSYAFQKPWLRRVLDSFSSDKGFYVLVQEAHYLYVYMIHPDSGEIKAVQVNQSQLLANPSTLDDLMAGRIIRRSVDLPSPQDVSLSVILVSQAGTEVTELDISYKYESNLKKYAEIDSEYLIETQHKLHGRPNDDSSADLSNLVNKENSQKELAKTLIEHRQFKKLAEVVLMRNKTSGNAAKGQYAFDQIGVLPMLLKQLVQKQREEQIMQILSMARYLQTMYHPEDKGMYLSIFETRRELIRFINLEIRKIDGIQTVYQAVLKRQNDQAQEITLQTKGNRFRDLDLIEVREIKKYLQQVIQKQTNLLRLLLFFVQSDYLQHLYINFDRVSKIYKNLFSSGIWCLPQLNALTQLYDPSLFPLQAVADHVNFFDAGSLEDSLQLIYYQLLSLPSHVEAHFVQVLGTLMSEYERANIKAIWSVDHLGVTRMMNEFKIVEELIRTQERHSHLDHLIFQKLVRESPSGKEVAQMFLASGACRSQVHLSNFETLRIILEFYANNNDLQGFIGNYLKETESTIKQDLYERILEAYLSHISKSVDLAYQKALLQIQFTKKQTLIIESILQSNYPTLMITYKLSRRQVPQALGTAMRIGHFQSVSASQQHFSNQSIANAETASLVRDYMATLTREQQRQVFEESKVGPAAQQEIYADFSSNYKAINKIRYPGGGVSSKESDQIFFDPSQSKQQVDVQQTQAKQVVANKKTFTDFFGFSDGNQRRETQTFSELMAQPSSYIDLTVPSIPEPEKVQQITRLFNGPVQIAKYEPANIENVVRDVADDSRVQTDEDMRQDVGDDHEMQPDESDSSFHNNRFITNIHGEMPPPTTTSAAQPRSSEFFIPDPLNPGENMHGGAAIRFPTQGSLDEIPSGGHIMFTDENLLNGSSLDGLHEDPINEMDDSANHVKIEEQQHNDQFNQSDKEMREILDIQKQVSRMIKVSKVGAAGMSNISEIPHESDSQSNNPAGSIRGLGEMNRSYTTAGGPGVTLTPTRILDSIQHRNSLDVVSRPHQEQQPPVVGTPSQQEEEKQEKSDIDSSN